MNGGKTFAESNESWTSARFSQKQVEADEDEAEKGGNDHQICK